MTGRFVGRVAFVTGSASGIGAAIVESLVSEGARVVGFDVADQSATAHRHGDAFLPATVDVTDEIQIRDAVTAGVEHFGGLDLAFNVAGAHRGGSIMEMDRANWDFTVELVLTGVFLSTKYEARALRARGGSIVNIGSINGRVPMRGGAAYVSAKAGVEAFTRNAALELGQHGIRVTWDPC